MSKSPVAADHLSHLSEEPAVPFMSESNPPKPKKAKPSAEGITKKGKTTTEAKVIAEEKAESAVKFIDNITQKIVGGSGDSESEDLAKVVRGPIVFGLWVVFIFFGVFGTWSALAPLNSAAIAPGTVVVDSNKKVIQHLEGGIVDAILVKEGDVVKKGQPLIRLNKTMAQARDSLIEIQTASAQATEARLIAERDKLETIKFPPELWAQRDNPKILDVLEGEQRVFETRMKALNGNLNVLQQRINQLKDEISGLEAQKKATRDQLALIKEERTTVKQLLDKGIAQKPRYLALQRQEAELKGKLGEYTSLIAKAKQAITESELEVMNTRNRHLNEVVEELQTVQQQVSDLKERKNASQDVLNRVVINAPQEGVITGLTQHTVGGVVKAGEPIMYIVPKNDTLVIKAKVSPRDIDVVHPGLPAQVILSAYKTRTVPRLDATVVQVSADRFEAKSPYEQPYFEARVLIDPEMLGQIEDIKLYPGMPADVLIVTGERTFLSYLFSPITDSFGKSFKEE